MDTNSPIAVVADDAAVRDSLKILLECHGFRVCEYGGALAFLADSSLDAFCCAIVNLHQPGFGGQALLRALQLRRRNLPVVMLVGHSCAKVAALSAGATAAFDLPVAEGALLCAIRTLQDTPAAAE